MSLSTMQTARTTGKGELAGRVSSGITAVDIYPMANVEFAARYGCTEQVDVGLKFDPLGLLTADVKTQFAGNKYSLLAAGMGAGFGIGSYKLDDSTHLRFSNSIMAMYFSVHPFRWLSIYCSPKYIYARQSKVQDKDLIDLTNTHIGGATAGIKLGNRYSIMYEMTMMRDYKRREDYFQVMLGFGFGIQ